MIRAVVKDGAIQPLEPLPTNWEEGHQVIVSEPEGESGSGAEEPNRWALDMESLTAVLDDPQEWREIETALAAAGQAKSPN